MVDGYSEESKKLRVSILTPLLGLLQNRIGPRKASFKRLASSYERAHFMLNRVLFPVFN